MGMDMNTLLEFDDIKDQMQGIIKVAGVAKRMGILTVGVVTIPFYFEKKRKIIKALKCISELITLPRELVVSERGLG